MKKILIIFLTGILILSVAIILNILANFLQLTTWHELLSQSETSQTGITSLIFLFVIYPFTLGLIAYLFLKKVNEKK